MKNFRLFLAATLETEEQNKEVRSFFLICLLLGWYFATSAATPTGGGGNLTTSKKSFEFITLLRVVECKEEKVKVVVSRHW